MSREHRRVRSRSVESPFVAAALGFASFAAKLDRILESSAPPAAGIANGKERPRSVAEEEGLYLLLGLAAAKERLVDLLEGVAPPPVDRPSTEAARDAVIERSLLR